MARGWGRQEVNSAADSTRPLFSVYALSALETPGIEKGRRNSERVEAGLRVSVEPLKEGASHPTEGDLTDGSSPRIAPYQNVNPWIAL